MAAIASGKIPAFNARNGVDSTSSVSAFYQKPVSSLVCILDYSCVTWRRVAKKTEEKKKSFSFCSLYNGDEQRKHGLRKVLT